MFYFQSMFQQVYNGITGSAVLPAVQQIAEAILLLAALFAVYEAYPAAHLPLDRISTRRRAVPIYGLAD